MIHEFNKPIPVVTPMGDAYAIYCTSNGMLENDEWTCALIEDGQIRHFLTNDIKIWSNGTYGINIKSEIDGNKK